ncbi:MAG: ATP-dependent DNA helicase RecG [Bacteroidales bacterium]|nr:ATP-dependent DNA helicase RecG [Bacteroidales bacterium]
MNCPIFFTFVIVVQPFLSTPIEYLKGVGPIRGELLRKELQVNTFGELLSYFPFRYVDRSKFFRIADIREEVAFIQVKAVLRSTQTVGAPRSKRLVATVEDHTGTLDLVWFKGHKWVADKLFPGREYVIFGRPTRFSGRWNIAHPELELASDQPPPLNEILRPFYSSSEKLKAKGLDSRGISKLVSNLLLLDKFYVPETIPGEILQSLKLIQRQEAFVNIHFPGSPDQLKRAQTRLKFEELFFIQLRLIQQKFFRLNKQEGIRFTHIGEYVNRFYSHHLTFELTGAQKRVIKEIRADLGSGKQMNRLLQGDVGSGKTLVALMTMLIALDNGYQACIMAPTEILANQHFQTISTMVKDMGVEVRLLTGSTKSADRKEIQESLIGGDIHFMIGTHALLEEYVRFKNLGLVVIDEQHRFGVAQRAKLWDKNKVTPHVLVMTATPIPRTLAMTLYGDLDASVIDEMPPGRKPVVTRHAFESKRLELFGFLKKKIKEGRQVYIVYPLIKESESMDLKNLMEGYDAVVREFPLPDFAISIVHGQMKPANKDYEMQRFIRKQTQIMVATTVIEVGVDIPNASVMVIENAERFGLSQLHQLRGRVGRGSDQSFCILMTSDKLTNDARKRIQTMVHTTDGFAIAETDLQLRGPGDLEGTQQSGILDLKIADIVKDEKVLKYCRSLALRIIEEDPGLERPENERLNHHLRMIHKYEHNWGLIS